MSLLQNMKVAAGVGATELTIALDHAEHFRGGPVSGQLQVRGGELSQTGSLEIHIEERWQQTTTRNGHTTTQTRTRQHAQAVVATDFPIPAGAAFAWPFQLPIPRGADLDHSWSGRATMLVPSAIDRHAEAALHPYPSAALFALKQAMCQFASFQQHGMGALDNSSEAHLDLAPPDDLKHKLDGVRFVADALMPAGFWSGQIEINPQETSVGGFLKSLVHADRVRHPLTIPLELLRLDRPIAPELVEQLRGFLQPHLD